MNMEQLECFIAIVECGSYSEAAEILHISQSSLSKKILSLEKELNVTLFSREKRKIEVTPIGLTIYEDAKEIIKMKKVLFEHIKQYSSSNSTIVNLATLPIMTQYNLTSSLKAFKELHPSITLHVEEVEDNEIINGLDENKFNLAILRDSCIKKQPHKYDTWPIATDELCLITSQIHPLSRRKSISLEALINENFIFMNKHTSIYDLCIDACKNSGYIPKVLRTARIETIINAVELNEGISLMMKKNLSIFKHNKISIIPLEAPVTSTVILAKLKSKKLNKYEKLFLDYFKNL